MNKRNLQKKRALCSVLFVLLLSAIGTTNGNVNILTQKIYTINENKKAKSIQQYFIKGTICPMPSFLEVYNITAHEATLIWENVGDLYDLELKEANDVEWQIIEIVGNTITITDMTPNTTYNIRIRTICDPDYEVTSDWKTINFTTEPFSNQTITALSSGWNWFSSNVEITLDDLEAALVEALPNTAITIQSQTQNTTYNPNNNRWTGRLTYLDVTQMYKINVSSDCEITLAGTPINLIEHSVIIQNGNNWIGYPLHETMSVNDALVGFPAVNGDIIQSQKNNSVFTRGAWRGALMNLEPGQGYIFQSTVQEDRTLTFPAGAK